MTTVRWYSVLAVVTALSLGGVCAASASATFEGTNGRIVWSRDGDVFTMRADGSLKRRVTQNGRYESAQWSPDGRQLAITQWPAAPGQRTRIFVVSARGENERVVARVRYSVASIAWSPDGSRLAVCDLDISHPDEPAPYPSAIKVIDVATSASTRLTEFPERACGPTWSPDGTRIAYVAGDEHDTDIHLMNADGTDRSVVVQDHATRQHEISWSPTADVLAFTSWDPAGEGQGSVEVVGVDGTGRQVVSSAPAGVTVHHPAWSPDGGSLLFFRLQAEPWSVSLRVIAGDGTPTLAVPGVELGHAAWSPDSTHVVFGRTGDIFTTELAGGPTRVAGRGTRFDGSPDWQAR